MPSNEQLLAGFVDYLKVEKGLARLTVAAYTRDIGQFAEFLEKRRRTLLAARRGLSATSSTASSRTRSTAISVARKLSCLRHLYKYLLLDRLIAHDPT